MNAKLPSGIEMLELTTASHANGCQVVDSNGKKFIDFINGYGAVLLGHAHSKVTEAILSQAKKGILISLESELKQRVELLLLSQFPFSEAVHFVKTGSEANQAAIRLARAFTGKMAIIRCGFSGWHDQLICNGRSWHRMFDIPRFSNPIAGIPPEIEKHSLVWDGAKLDELHHLIVSNRENIAALLLDPVQLREDIELNLLEISGLCREHNILLILDEVKTGFRVAIGGVQKKYGISADITVVSKGMANGLPLAAVMARKEIMKYVKKTKLMGTYNSDLISLAAAEVVLTNLNSSGVSQMWERGEQLIDGINYLFSKHGLESSVQASGYRWVPLPFIKIKSESNLSESWKKQFYKYVSDEGILWLPNHMNFITLAHSKNDIDEALLSFDHAIEKICIEYKNPDKKLS